VVTVADTKPRLTGCPNGCEYGWHTCGVGEPVVIPEPRWKLGRHLGIPERDDIGRRWSERGLMPV